jgi:hypothetical protein
VKTHSRDIHTFSRGCPCVVSCSRERKLKMAEPVRRHRVMGLFSDDKQRSTVARNLAQRTFQQFADDNAKTLDNKSRRILETSDARQRVESDDEAEVAAAVGQLTSAAASSSSGSGSASAKRRGAVGLFGGKRKQQAGEDEQSAKPKANKKARFEEPAQSESDTEASDEEMEETKEQEALEASLLESDASDGSDSDSQCSDKGENDEDIDVVNDSEEEEEEEEEEEGTDDPMGGSDEEAEELPEVDSGETETAAQSNVSAADESTVSDQPAPEEASHALDTAEAEEEEESEQEMDQEESGVTHSSAEASEAPVDHSLAPSDVVVNESEAASDDSEAPEQEEDEEDEEEEQAANESSAQQESSAAVDDSAEQSEEQEEEEEEDATVEQRSSLQSEVSTSDTPATSAKSSSAVASGDASSSNESSGQLLDNLPSESQMTSETLTSSEIERILDGRNIRLSESTAAESSVVGDHSLSVSAVSEEATSSSVAAAADMLESALGKMTDYPWNLLDPQNASRVTV